MEGSGVLPERPGSQARRRHHAARGHLRADDYDEASETGWSVVVKGRADLVTDADELERLRDSGIRPWTNPTLRTNWVTLHATDVTGRRILPDPRPA